MSVLPSRNGRSRFGVSGGGPVPSRPKACRVRLRELILPRADAAREALPLLSVVVPKPEADYAVPPQE